MRMLSLDIDYETYRKVADAILEIIPFANINMEFSKKLGKGFFYFWDVAYIPPALLKFAKFPPKTHENVEKLQDEILKALGIEKIIGDHECIDDLVIKMQDTSLYILRDEDGTAWLMHQSMQNFRVAIWYCPYCGEELNA